MGDGSLLFAGFPLDVLAQGVCLGLDVGLGRHGLDVGLDGLTDGVGQRDFGELGHDGEPGVQVVIEADGQRLHDTSSLDLSCRGCVVRAVAGHLLGVEEPLNSGLGSRERLLVAEEGHVGGATGCGTPTLLLRGSVRP